MSQVRLSEEKIALMRGQLSHLKANREQVLEIENLRNFSEWKSLKAIIEARIKSMDTIIDMCLDAEISGQDNLIALSTQAREARVRKKTLLESISLIDNPGDSIKRMDGQISKITDMIKKAEDGELL